MMRIKLHYLRLALLLSLTVLFTASSRAQCTSTINFESTTSSVHASSGDATPTATSFTHIGKTFNITSQTSGEVMFVDGTYPADGYGWSGSAADNIYISNNGYASTGTGVQFTIATSDNSLFSLKSFWLQITDASVLNPVSATVTITGKIGSTTVFTATKSTGWVTSFATNNGFNLIDLSTLGGVNNSNSLIDRFVITTSSGAPYFQLDALTLSNSQPVATTSAATSITATGATLNGAINAHGFSTNNAFQYSTSSTLSSGVTSVTATPGTATGSSNTSVSVTLTGLTTGTTYYFRALGSNCGGIATGSILSFTPTSASSLTATQSQTNVSCTGGSDGTATVTPSGGTTPYTYSWSPSGGTSATATGLSAGTYTCTITDAASASVAKVFTLTETAITISGTATVCPSGTTTLTPSVTGGTWGSGSTATATVGASNGVVTGIIAGATASTVVITYNPTGGCSPVTKVITVNAGPAAIVGNGSFGVCNLANIQFTNTVSGGTWSSSNATVATVNPTTGMVRTLSASTSLSAGTVTISYTVAGCTRIVTTNISNNGATPTGVGITCIGGHWNIVDAYVGGTWSSATPAVGTIDSFGYYTAIAAGMETVQYSCGTNAVGIASRTFSVVPTPTPIQGTFTVCPTSTTTLTDSASWLGSYLWTSSNSTVATVGSVSGVVTGVAAGTARITFANSCGTVVQIVTVNGTPSVSPITGTMTVNVGSTTTLSSTTPGGVWASSSPSIGSVNTSGVVTGIGTGTATISYTVNNGCFSTTVTANVTVSLGYSATQSQTNVSCNGGSNGTATVTVSGGTTPYTYSWSPGGGSAATATDLSAGTYTCTITDAASSTLTKIFTITEPAALTTSVATTTNATCGSSDGSASISASGGTPSYTYSWAPGGATSASATGLSAGTYTCTVTDANSCTAAQVVTVSNTSITISGTATMCPTGTATLTPSVTGGTWSSSSTSTATVGASNGVVTGVIAGSTASTAIITYTTASCGTATKVVTVNAGPSAITGNGSFGVCNLANIQFTNTVSGGTWSSSNATVATVNPTTGMVRTLSASTSLSAGTVTISYTVASCTRIVTTNVSNNGATPVGVGITCIGGHWNITDAYVGGSWSSATPAVGTIDSFGFYTAIAAGMETVQYSCGTNAVGIASRTFSVVPTPTPIQGTFTVCPTSTTALTDSASWLGSYLWTSSNSTVATVGSVSGVVTGVAAGTARITFANSCGTVVQIVTVNGIPSVSSIGGSTLVAIDSTITLTDATSGGVWTSGSTEIAIVGSASGVVTGVNEGTVTITYTVNNGCFSNTATRIVTVNNPALVATQSQTNVVCNGGSTGSASVVASGGTPGYTYSWAPSGGSAATATGLAAGTYTCTITDAASASITKTFTITQPTALTASLSSQTNVSCFGGSNGSATISATGGTTGLPTPPPSYSYSWAPSGGSSATASGLAAGTYTCTVTDAHSCTTTQAVTITQPSAITTSVAAQTNVACNGGNTGAATISATGGTGTLTYSWAPAGGTSATATGLSAGTYTCTVTDANSCTKIQTVTITQPSALAITSTASNSPVCAGSTLNLTSGVSGGTTPYTYSWSGPSVYTSTDANPSVTSVTAGAAGTYSLSVTDNNGCSAPGTHTVSVTINSRPVLSSLGNNGPICSTFNLNLSSSVVSGATPYAYSWSGPNSFTSTLQNPTITSATTAATGTYSLNVTDANGCTLTVTGTTAATVNPRPTLSSIGNNSPVCSGNTLSFSSSASGGTGTLTYAWAGPGPFTSTAANPSIASALTVNTGAYTLTITDGVGCHATGTNTIAATVNARPSVSAISNNGPICAGVTLDLTKTVTGGTTPYSYSWSGPNSFSSTASNPSISSATTAATGVYTFVVTDVNGCSPTSASTTSATVNPRPSISSIGNNGPICSGVALDLNSTAGGGTGTLSYSWSGPASFTSTVSNPSITAATSAATGTYSLTVTDINGCTATGANTTAAIVNDRPVLSSISNNGPVCSGNTLNLMSTVTGGTAPITYSWSGPDSFTAATANPSISGATTAATGTYTLVVSDANSCNAVDANTTAATVNPLPATIAGNGNICIGFTTTLSNITGTGSWSSSDPATASVDASGVVSGNVLGTATISYTLSTGCYMTKDVTVNAFPAAISGPASICAGANITMSDATSGGAWSSSNTSVATIDASTGVVTGLTAGTVVFTYTSGAGCAVSSSPVNNMVSAITGTGGTCLGLTMSFTDGTTGGTWSSSNAAVGSINSSTGSFSSLSGGSTTVTYTVGSCYRVLPVTVATAPPDITGNTEICIAGTTALSNTAVGGTWTRWASTSIVTDVTYTGGLVTGVASGTSVITYALSHSCFTTIVITVDPTPVITGPMTLCNGTTGTLASSVTGGSWASNNASIVSIDASGNITAHAVGTAHITYTPVTGCYKEVAITVISGPAAITSPNSICVSSTGAFFDATSGGTGWSSSNTSVATINALSGIATGVAPGTATITFTVVSGCVSTKVLTVNALPDVITGTATVCNGQTTTLTSAPTGGTWSASSGVATVDASGVVTGATSGTVTIDYSIGVGCNRTKVVTVNPLPAVIGGPGTVCIGSAGTFTNTTTGGSWSSSNTAAGTINASTGVMTALSTGTTTVSYTLGTGCARSTNVTVNSIAASTGNAPVCQGQTITLSNATTGGTWASSNAAVATVNSSTGVVTGVSAGNASISYILGTGCTTITAVTVNASPATITGTMNVNVGLTTTLSDAVTGGAWSSSNTGKATVDAGTGVVTGIDTGIVTITYTIGGCYRTATVTINAALPPFTGPTSLCVGGTVTLIPPVTGVSWESSNTSVATIGSISGVVNGITPGTTTITFTFIGGAKTTQVLTVYALPAAITGSSLVCQGAATTFADASTGGTWASSNAVVGTIDATSGVLTGLYGGTTSITYSLNGCNATKAVTVGAIPAPITGQPAICVGTPVTFYDVTTGCVWSSSSTSIATVSAISGGASVIGVSAGNVTISYTYAVTGCSRTYDVTVGSMSPITGSLSACTGVTNALSNTSAGGAWTSSNLGVATVGATTGIVTGMTVGTARITYTYTSTCKAFAIVTVSASPAAITGATGVCLGATTTLADATTGGTWSSANTSLATVGASTGLVSGLVSGTTSISYTIANGCSKTYTMTVKALPAAIGGSATACTGAATGYTDGSGAGAWSSSTPAVGTIGAASGVLMPLTTGTTNITFTLTSTGCSIAKTVTVNTAGTISGATTVSKAASLITPVPYTDAVSGGSWSTSNVARATIGSSTGLLTGVAAGTVTVSYSANGCVATLPITITTPKEVGNNMAAAEDVNTLELFPNPTNGTFTIRASSGGAFGIYTLEGKEALTINITEGDNVVNMPNNLAAGVYLCRFVAQNGNVTTIRLVYQP